MADLTTQVVVEALVTGVPSLLATQVAIEVLTPLGVAVSPDATPVWVGDPQGVFASVTAFDPSSFDPGSFEE